MQKILHKIGLAIPSLVLAVTTLAVVPAFAQHGAADTSGSGSDSSSTETDTSSSGSGSSGSSSSSSGKEVAETETHASETAKTAFRTKGSQMVAELEQQHKNGKSAEDKTKACEAHKQGLQNKFTHITTNATNLETKIGAFETKATTYQSANNVTVDNWDGLVAAADTAKTNVDTAITNLKAVTPSLDCNNTSVASDVATFKAGAQDVRDALKAYKTAVKNVFVALQQTKDANASATTTTEGSDQ